MLKYKLVILLIILSGNLCFSQNRFVFEKKLKKEKISFELINNLIIVPVLLDGIKLSFLLDTGVSTSLLFSLTPGDSINFDNAKKVKLRAFGGKDIIEAYRSENHELKIGKVANYDLPLYLIFDEEVNFSPRLGLPVHGIIGYDFFKDFVVEINYARKFLKVYDPVIYTKKLRSYREIPLRFHKNKPYMKATLGIDGDMIEATLLLDDGLGDGLWLFSSQDKEIPIPENSFSGFIGLGLRGDVIGERAKISELWLADYKLKQVTTSFPDSSSFEGIMLFNDRSGSIGGQVLKKFNLILDYQGQKMYLKKNRNFNKPFHFNMSGIIMEL